MDGRLPSILVVQKNAEVADSVAKRLQRLAHETHVSHDIEHARQLLSSHQPKLLVATAELGALETQSLLSLHQKLIGEGLRVCTFHDLAPSAIKPLHKAGADELFGFPLDYDGIYRLVGDHFGIRVRQHPRHAVEVSVHRPDGMQIGTTRNLSLGGMMIECTAPMVVGQTALVNIALAEHEITVRAEVLAVNDPDSPTSARCRFVDVKQPTLDALERYFTSVGVSEH